MDENRDRGRLHLGAGDLRRWRWGGALAPLALPKMRTDERCSTVSPLRSRTMSMPRRALAACLFLLGGTGAGTYAQDRVLKMDVRNRPPDILIDDSGKCTGPLIDIIEYAAAKLGYTLKYQQRQFDGSLLVLPGGAIDLVPRAGWTEERAKSIEFLGPIGYEDKDVLFLVKKGKEGLIKSYADLAHLSIGVKRGSIYFDRFDKDASLKRIESQDDDNMVKMFEAGRFDTMITIDKNALEAALKKNNIGNYAYAQFKYVNSLGVFYGIAPHHPLKVDLQKILDGMIKSGMITEIYKKHGVAPLYQKK
jgi:polar amino acid transport system substrate-binding protein